MKPLALLSLSAFSLLLSSCAAGRIDRTEDRYDRREDRRDAMIYTGPGDARESYWGPPRECERQTARPSPSLIHCTHEQPPAMGSLAGWLRCSWQRVRASRPALL